MRAYSTTQRHPSRPASTAVVLLIAALGLLIAGLPLTQAAAPPSAPIPAATALATTLPAISDGKSITLRHQGVVLSVLSDQVQYLHGTGGYRQYSISVVATVGLPLTLVSIASFPLTVLAQPQQMPGGANAIPPFAWWSFTVYSGGHNDTRNWTANASAESLTRTAAWVSGSFVLTGSVRPVLPIQVNPTQLDGFYAPGSGFVANGIFAPGTDTANNPGFNALAAATHPRIIRVSLTTVGVSVGWNSATGQPVFGRWGVFNNIVNFSRSLGAAVYLSLPAGTWGNGNTLPTGMPLDPNVSVVFPSGTGSFPTPRAYSAYVRGLALHMVSLGLKVKYWNIGNEVPRSNATEVSAFVAVFNAGEAAIHQVVPNALVGSDVMMDPNYIDQFAKTANGVGFLSFHFYAVSGMCVNATQYCPPAGGSNGVPDPSLIARSSEFATMRNWLPPTIARMTWRNLTGTTLPVIDSESNLNHEGGALSPTTGTDPRIQSLFGAQWWAGLYLDAAQQHVQNLMYYTLAGPSAIAPSATSAVGGWGFQMVRENASAPPVLYAPYWSALLWAEGVPPRSHALVTNGSVDGLAEAQAFQNGSGISVVVVNHVNSTVRFNISLAAPGYVPASLTVLDRRSYSEVWNSTNHQEVLLKSGILNLSRSKNPVSFQIRGYGVALLQEVPAGHRPLGGAPRLAPLAIAGLAGSTLATRGDLDDTAFDPAPVGGLPLGLAPEPVAAVVAPGRLHV